MLLSILNTSGIFGNILVVSPVMTDFDDKKLAIVKIQILIFKAYNQDIIVKELIMKFVSWITLFKIFGSLPLRIKK